MSVTIDLSDYDAVVSDVYDAALSPAHWDVALTNLVHRFGRDRWDVAMLVWERITPPAGRFLGATGVHEVARQGYLQMFAGNNEWSVRGHDLPVGTVIHSDRLVDRADFRTTSFHTDYLASFQLEVGVLALLDRHRDDHLCLCLPGPDTGPVPLLEAAVRMLLPHIQRSARIARRIGEAELTASTARAALDRAPSPVLMCDGMLRVTYANSLAEQMIGQGYFVVREGRLVSSSADITRQLRRLAAPESQRRCFAFMAEPGNLPPLGVMAMHVGSGTGGVDRPAPGAPDLSEARLMIVAGRNHKASFANVDHLKDWFNLTAAEARLAATLAEGGSLEDFAETRGISMNAVRFLLKGVFAKTETNRQPQLVAKLQATPLQWHIGNVATDLPGPLH